MKLLLKKIFKYFGRQQCFCKNCGKDIPVDYSAPDDLDYIDICYYYRLDGIHCLCFDCFAWGLVKLKGVSVIDLEYAKTKDITWFDTKDK